MGYSSSSSSWKRLISLAALAALISASFSISPALALSSPSPIYSSSLPSAFVPAYSQQPPSPSLPGFSLVGPLPGDEPVLVSVTVPLRNQGLLYSMAEEISTPGSPEYDHFLTRSQAEELFYPTQEFDRVESYLESHGFRIEFAALDSALVAVGTASQVKEYLGLSVDLYSNGTLSYYATSGTPSISGAYVYVSNATSVLLWHPPDMVTGSALRGIAAIAGPNQTLPAEGMPVTYLRSAYNETGLLSSGYNGSGRTIGILDFYGDPYIAGQLAAFDSEFGIQGPPNFTVVPIGPYDPGIGIIEGWAGEISGDVEISHAMAPGANMTLYVANGALPLGSIIAYIVQQDSVDVLSQSFSIPESYVSSYGASFLESNIISADQYYALGTAEGITFIASTGDAGGSGYSAGPLGTPGYPSTSPFVTAAGGTTVYASGNSTVQTAWSNYGFVPFLSNYGGSTGGVSSLEPLPWYQSGASSIQVPASYPNGRMVPDLSLSASPYPGTWVVYPGNSTGTFGGTSEASPLLAGVLAVVVQATGHRLGLLNPFLYSRGYSTGSVDPVTFGYNIPWVAGPGYNLVTGLGTPNAGMMALALEGCANSSSAASLNMTVQALGPSMEAPANNEFFPGQEMVVLANITRGGEAVTAGNFSADLVTLQGNLSSTPLQYSPALGEWVGRMEVPAEASGIAYVEVSGSSSGVQGNGMTEVFAGYVAQYLWPPPVYPESSQFGIQIYASVTDLSGNVISPANVSVSVVPMSYNVTDNEYSPGAPVALQYYPWYGLWTGYMGGSYPLGPMVLETQGAYGYLPFMQGADLQDSFILPQVVAEPGSVAPGQSIFVQATVIPPFNSPSTTSLSTGLPVSYNAMFGSNMTVELLNSSGIEVASAPAPASPTDPGIYEATLRVPSNSTPGIYTVILSSSYNSMSLGAWINGSFFGQIYVSPLQSTPRITVASSAYEGQPIEVEANITYANGTEVRYGMYVASVYSSDLQSEYGQHALYGIPLHYDPSTDTWVGSAQLPSPYEPFAYNATTGSVAVGPQGYSGPYDVFVSGISWDGVPTNASLSAQRSLYVSPIIFLEGRSLVRPVQTSGLALMDDNLTMSSGSMHDDVFLGVDSIEGPVNISSSSVNGTLYLRNSTAVLEYVTGGNVVAVGSELTLIDSHLSSLTLLNSTVSVQSSTISSISPAPPSIDIVSPLPDVQYGGAIPVEVNVTGQSISSVSVSVDGSNVYSTSHGGLLEFQLNASSYPDGTHELEVLATQSDGISSSSLVQFETGAQLVTLTHYLYAVLGIALAALVLSLVALELHRRRSAGSGAPSPATSSGTPPPPTGPS
ncbi:protease pro-enzyme activation domain-containing protein [Conexivisphaera calida]|uniref:protease pro-enzyme activation domain-containing protein n=1 Tax=Conexivisphaera calida TaxID=1874277 RepID=UPI00157B7E63|nr:protease pro-enzyme activation domain-containing protein [Conexivisphaera calida]